MPIFMDLGNTMHAISPRSSTKEISDNVIALRNTIYAYDELKKAL